MDQSAVITAEDLPAIPTSTVTEKQLTRAVLTGAVGSALEYYDFAIYGLASALVFGKFFFPTLGTEAGLMASFATYGVGFIARPFGGMFFSSLGDRKGRKLVLQITIALMGVSTMLIGLLPAGTWGAIALVLLRLAQGFGAGAEQAGAITLMAEFAPVKRRGFYASLPFVGLFAGLMLATLTFRTMQYYLGQEAMQEWGWRIPFLSSIFLIAIAVWIRFRLTETPTFTKLSASRQVIKAPVRTVIKEARPTLIATILMRMSDSGGSALYNQCAMAFLTGFVVKKTSLPVGELAVMGTTAVLVASFLSIFTTPIAGALSDRFGRLPVFRFGAWFLLLWSIPSWWMINTGEPFWVTLAVVGGFAIGANIQAGVMQSHYSELFGNRYRYSGVALAREVSALLAAGIAPLLGIYLTALAGGAWWVFGVYTAVLSLMAVVGTYLSKETRGRDLSKLEDALSE